MLKFINRSGLSILAMFTAATTSLSLFIKVAEEVIDGDTHEIDHSIILLLRDPGNVNDPLGPKWIEDYVRDFTALGSPGVLGLFIMIASAYLALLGLRRLSAFILLTTTCGTLAVTILKDIFARPRPQLMPDGLLVYMASFPSGHAMISALVYLTLGALIARLAPTTLLKFYIMSIACLLTGIVGFSRVYLGAHWPSDVLAGWSIGAAWAFSGGILAQTHFLDKDNPK